MKEEYVDATVDIIELDSRDIISTSDCDGDFYCPQYECPFDGWDF